MSRAAAKTDKTPSTHQRRKSGDRSLPQQNDPRRRLEDRLNELKLKKELQEFDFEY